MKSTLLSLVATALAVFFVSCTPYDNSGLIPPAEDVAQNTAREAEAQQELAKKKAEEAATRAAQEKEEALNNANSNIPKLPEQLTDPAPTPSQPGKPSIPVARAVPGKAGFVFSPFNNKIIDVKDLPSGQLVADPTYPASEKKYFRVP